ncbi:MAG: hypothetical protein AB7H77_01820 [Bdellovibrionales bacterium]
MNEKFADLGAPRRIWVIAAVHGDIDRLSTLHDYLATRFSIRDRVVYLGNYLGTESVNNAEVFDELLAFRAALLAKPGVEPTDIVHLRGPSEEAWLRLLRLQFAPVAIHALEKLLASGVEAYLRVYGVSLNDTKSMARAGSMAITRWTNQLRVLQRHIPGHENMFCSMRRAAFAQESGNLRKLLLVPAGFDSTRSLEDQGDALWWSATPFLMSGRAQTVYSRIVRGFDSVNNGISLEDAAITLDGGCGRGGPLACGCFAPDGRLIEMVTVGGPGIFETTPFNEVLTADEKFMHIGKAPLAMPAPWQIAGAA